jgi:hypothetical protein
VSGLKVTAIYDTQDSRANRLPPDIPEQLGAHRRIPNSVRDTAMPEVVLEPPGIYPLVRQGIAACMAQHMDVDPEGNSRCALAAALALSFVL